jgi:hypothetical protein
LSLPIPFLEPEPWQFDSKCGEQVYDPATKDYKPVYNADLWFPPRDKKLYKPIADKAKSICYGKDGKPECPVRMQCLLFADKNDEVHGIWGGMSHRERNALKRKANKLGTTLEALAKKGK